MNTLRSFVAVAVAAATLTAPPAYAEPQNDPGPYFEDLTHFGIKVAGNEEFLLTLADMTCAMRKTGLKTAAIGDFISDTYNIPDRDANNIASGAYVWYCP